MKVYCILTQHEVSVLMKALQHSDSKKERDIGDKICSAVNGEPPCDMNLEGLDEEELSE